MEVKAQETRGVSLRLPKFACFLLCLPLLLAGCVTLSDPETSQESSQDVVGLVSGTSGEKTVRQTFISRRSGLNGLTLWLAPETRQPEAGPAQGILTVELYRLQESQDLNQANAPIFTGIFIVKARGPIQISLPSRPDPPGQPYVLLLKTTGEAPIQVLGRLGDVYQGGQAYQGNQPIDADIAFRTSYRYEVRSIREDLGHYSGSAWLALPLGLTLLLPGWLALDLSGLRKRFDLGEQVALSIGLSLAIIPVGMLWSSWVGLRWSRLGIWCILAILAGLGAWRMIRPAWAQKIHLGNLHTQPATRNAHAWLFDLALAWIFMISLAVRLAMVRDMAAPAWVDSVHHGLITRLMTEYGGFPETYAPYLSLDPTKYHAGYHSSLAVFQWISGLDLTTGMLLFGQFLNALIVYAVYLLATTLTNNRLAGLLAALTAGLFTPMPAYYTSWGRYTQLAGLIILPTALALARLALPSSSLLPATEPRPDPPVSLQCILCRRTQAAAMILGGLSLAGLVLVHYRVAAFLTVLFPSYVLILLIGVIRKQPADRLSVVKKFLIPGIVVYLGGFLLTLPWMGPNLTRVLPTVISPENAIPTKAFSDFSWRFLDSGLGEYVTALAGIGLVLGLLQRQNYALVLLCWVAGMFLLANLGALGIPGSWLINNTSVTITLFMPIAVSAGSFLSQFSRAWSDALPVRWRRLYWISLGMAGIALTMFGARNLLPILNPTTYLFREADRPAIAWIKDNIPPEETILINPFLWGYGVYAGIDGGFWISPLSGHKTYPPPVLYGFGSQAEYYRIEAICKQAIAQGSNPQELWSLLQQHKIRYVYLGVRGGPLSAFALSNSSHFRALYNQNGTWVFEVVDKE